MPAVEQMAITEADASVTSHADIDLHSIEWTELPDCMISVDSLVWITLALLGGTVLLAII
jgi:hypothetical protein